jgi:hypothetical protein
MDRAPIVAGRFYPEDPERLTDQLRGYLGPEPTDAPAIGAIVPHAGYRYSGAIAGQVFGQVRIPRHVVLLGPNHTGHGERAAIMTHGNWRLPGGHVPIDSAVAEDFRRGALLTEDIRAHAEEHSIEVQLPFLAYRNPKVRIVPVCLGMMPYASCVRIGTALADLVTMHGRDVLIVASTHMSHYLPADECRTRDEQMLAPLQRLDPEGLFRTVSERGMAMCGMVPTTVALIAARALGAREAELVRYGHSGETSGDSDRVVGYAGLILR